MGPWVFTNIYYFLKCTLGFLLFLIPGIIWSARFFNAQTAIFFHPANKNPVYFSKVLFKRIKGRFFILNFFFILFIYSLGFINSYGFITDSLFLLKPLFGHDLGFFITYGLFLLIVLLLNSLLISLPILTNTLLFSQELRTIDIQHYPIYTPSLIKLLLMLLAIIGLIIFYIVLIFIGLYYFTDIGRYIDPKLFLNIDLLNLLITVFVLIINHSLQFIYDKERDYQTEKYLLNFLNYNL